MIVGMLFLMVGCFPFGNSLKESNGKLKIVVDIPAEFRSNVSKQYIEHTIQLSTVEVILTKDNTTVSKNVNIEGESVEIVFDNLEAGKWVIDVVATDNDGYDVYSGNGTGIVEVGTLASANIELVLLPGNLDIQVTIPEGLQVNSGSVTLINLLNTQENLVSALDINGNVGLASFDQLISTTWPIEVRLFNSAGAEIGYGRNQIDVLPGRTTTAQLELDPATEGGLRITIEWELKPAAPTGLVGSSFEGSAVLEWDANSEDDIAGYVIYRSTSLDGQKLLLNDALLQDTTYTDFTVNQEQTYWYWVQAYDTKGYSSYLSEFCSVMVESFSLNKIVFESMRYNTQRDIYTVNADGTGLTNVSNYGFGDSDPSWSPDGKKVIYISNRDQNQVCIVNADGTEFVQLTSDDIYKMNPKMSPDGTKIAYETLSGSNKDIIVMNSDGSGQMPLTSNPGADGYFEWSPDGTEIVFTSDANGFSEVWLMNADGSNKRTLTGRNAYETSPNWSADGSKIVFVARDDNNHQIFVINSDGTGLSQLTYTLEYNTSPKWSPDGSKIVFTSNRDGNREIYVMDFDGSNQVRLTNNSVSDNYAQWSADGTMIGFVSGDFGYEEVCVMSPDGTNLFNVSNHSYEDSNFAWTSF